MRYSTKRDIRPRQLNELWKKIGWRARSPKKWKELLSKSSYVYSVWDSQKLIGFGRIIEDGIMCMFYDICVHPDYQGRGIGKKIMKALINRIKYKNYVSIGLFAWDKNPKNIPFYEKFGFKKVKTGMELVKYMKRE